MDRGNWGSQGPRDEPTGNESPHRVWYKSKNYGTAMEISHFPDKGTGILASDGTHAKSQSKLRGNRMQDE